MRPSRRVRDPIPVCQTLRTLARASPFMQRIMTSQLTPNLAVDQVFRVADKQLRTNRANQLYFLLRLADRGGVITAMMWNARREQFEQFQRGDFVRVNGTTQSYNGTLQLIVNHLEAVDSRAVDAADFDPLDQRLTAERLGRLTSYLQSFQRPALQALAAEFLADEAFLGRLSLAAAAVTHHHAYVGGLLEHTLQLMDLSDRVAAAYPQLDRDLLVFGAFLHDLGKIDELAEAGELNYTDRGQLVGHLVIGVQMLGERIARAEQRLGQPFPIELRWHLEHFILSHHGQLEFGSPKIPVTREAIALHYIDALDAKLAAASAVMQSDLSGDGNWTNYNPALGRKLWKGTV
jgi:3'-5' exoribonuclease